MMHVYQHISGETIVSITANQQDETHNDIHARGFGGGVFDVRVSP